MSPRIDVHRLTPKAPDEEVLSLIRRISKAAREDPEVRRELGTSSSTRSEETAVGDRASVKVGDWVLRGEVSALATTGFT